MPEYRLSQKARVVVTTGLLFMSSQTMAASFSVKEQNAAQLGTTYAGTAAEAADASTGFSNPAGLDLLKNDQVVLSAVGIKARGKHNVLAATNNGGAAIPTGRAVTDVELLIPGFYAAKRWNDQIVTSLNVAVPYGLKTKYEETSHVRYMATRSEVRTIALGPAISYHATDQLSLGAGVDALRAKAWLFSQGNVGLGEGSQFNRAGGWSWGWRVGVLYRLSEQTRMGLNYRDKYKVTATGHSTTAIPNVPTALQREVSAHIQLPEVITYSVYQDYDDNWSLLADVEWMHWSRFRNLILNFSGGTLLRTPEHYRNTWRTAFGLHYKYGAACKFKGGIAWDQSPTREAFRTTRIPDSNRVWLGLGVQYDVNEAFTVDAGYAHLFFNKGSIREGAPFTGTGALAGAQTLTSNYRAEANLVGIQLVWNLV